jgi:hypothetical protein
VSWYFPRAEKRIDVEITQKLNVNAKSWQPEHFLMPTNSPRYLDYLLSELHD